MKGPNASLPIVDDLHMRIRPFAWNNIPIPVCGAFEEIIKTFKEFKKISFQDYNSIVTTQRVVNQNMQTARADCQQVRQEAMDNLILSEEQRAQAFIE